MYSEKKKKNQRSRAGSKNNFFFSFSCLQIARKEKKKVDEMSWINDNLMRFFFLRKKKFKNMTKCRPAVETMAGLGSSFFLHMRDTILKKKIHAAVLLVQIIVIFWINWFLILSSLSYLPASLFIKRQKKIVTWRAVEGEFSRLFFWIPKLQCLQ